MVIRHIRRIAVVVAVVSLFEAVVVAEAVSPGNDAFWRTWARSDKPVADVTVNRTWMWGPQAVTDVVYERYDESPGRQRAVQYFDKARMEITHPDDDPGSLWYVTNGLLVGEMVTGRMQLGDNTFETRGPAHVNVAGDPDDPLGPTYATFARLLDAPPTADGALLADRLDRDGNVTFVHANLGYGVYAAEHVRVAGIDHQVASVFWDFMRSSGSVYENGQVVHAPLSQDPFYATGYPITEAYWTSVKIGGAYREVLVQCFERRCLTYNPANTEGWQVEAGNAGRHYYRWRYGHEPPGATPADEAACLNAVEQTFLHLINAYRAQHGLGPLSATRSLNAASYKHSLDMGARAFFDHTNPDGESPWDRMAEEGYTFNTGKAENIAAGYATAEEVFEGWRNSPGHNANMLNAHFTAIGIGYAVVAGSPYTHYWTTAFGGVVDDASGC